MKKLIPFLIVTSVLILSTAERTFPQEESSLFITNTQYKGNNSEDPNDLSGMLEERVITPQEINLMSEIKRIKQTDDPSQLNRLLELEAQLEALNPNSVSKPGEYYGGVVGQPYNDGSSFSPEEIGNVEIYNSGSSLISGIATATEQRGTTAGRIWTALAWNRTAASDMIRIYYSDDGGVNWTYYGWGSLGGTDRLNRDQMDMEIIENTTGEKYIWIVYGYRQDAGSGRWRTGGLIFQTPTFGAGFFALSWPVDDATKRYYGLRITSDNARWLSIPYVFMVASFDSLGAGLTHINTQKTVRCTSPFTTTPTFSYKADKFNWWSGTDGNMRQLHSDIAYFYHNGSDSIIVSFSNVPDSTKLFFAKSNNTNGPASSTGAGGFIGGTNPTFHKQYGRLASNGNDNGKIVCVFRENDSPWKIRYFRTTNWGNFNSMINSGSMYNTPSTSYQPDIVGVRGATTSYISFNVNAAFDSVYFVKVANGFTVLSRQMNSVSSVSGVQGPKPGFRYAGGDSCFAIYSPNGPYDVWAAVGCSGPPVNVMTPVLVAPPDNAIDVSINPTLTWNSVPNATDYHLRVYLNNTTLVVDDPNVGSTSLSIGPLDYLSMYTWEVAANYSFGTGPFADRFTFNTMAEPTSVAVTSPNGGEVWDLGTNHNITWTSTGVANALIELSINNGASWTTVIASTPSTGTYSWLVPPPASTQCLIRISDVGNPATNDVSDNVFTINDPPGVEEQFSGIPDDYALLQNYPNPFNPNTTIYYGLPEESSVELKIYDILGNQIMKYVEDQQAAGYHKINFDASGFISGIYFYQLQAGDFVETKKMILMK